MNTPEDFVFWLNGFLAANPHLKELNAEQTRRVKEKLSTVFTKVTPNYDPNNQTFVAGANTMELPIKDCVSPNVYISC